MRTFGGKRVLLVQNRNIGNLSCTRTNNLMQVSNYEWSLINYEKKSGAFEGKICMKNIWANSNGCNA